MITVRHYCEITEEEWKDQYQQFVDSFETDWCNHGLTFFFTKVGHCLGMASKSTGRVVAWIEYEPDICMERDHDEFILKDGSTLAIYGNILTSDILAELLNKKLT